MGERAVAAWQGRNSSETKPNWLAEKMKDASGWLGFGKAAAAVMATSPPGSGGWVGNGRRRRGAREDGESVRSWRKSVAEQ
ncbi:unnamed protein product [Linum trigynum]|uniref:Uncharacterized protein n=1 Tax=Linum trigynum TaxID=586398 RepID=A0AAV2ES73_9ROSI